MAICCVNIALAAWVLSPPPALQGEAASTTLHQVVLVVPGQSRSDTVDLHIENGRISRITPKPGQPVRGYVYPGLSNVHMHTSPLGLPGEDELFAFLHLYHGVTSARLAAGGESMVVGVASGDYPGPVLRSCGPFLDGEPAQWPSSEIILSAEDANRVIDALAAKGAQCVKVYNELTAPALNAIYDRANRHGIEVIGHVPWRIDLLDANIDDYQHVLGWVEQDDADGNIEQVARLLRLDSLSEKRVEDLTTHLLATQRSVTPTLITLQRKYSLGEHEKLAAERSALLLPAWYRERWYHGEKGLVSSRLFGADEHGQFRALFPKVAAAAKQLFDAGVEIRTGTDAPAEFIVPGAGLWEELLLMVSGGFTPEEALQASMINSARVVLGDSYQPLQLDSPAHLLVFTEDPSQQLSHLASLQTVVTPTALYSRDSLDAQLSRYQNWFNAPLYRGLTNAIIGSGLGLVNWLSEQR